VCTFPSFMIDKILCLADCFPFRGRGIAAPQVQRMMFMIRLTELKVMTDHLKSVLATPNFPAATRQQAEKLLANFRQQYAATFAEYERDMRALGRNVERTFKIFL